MIRISREDLEALLMKEDAVIDPDDAESLVDVIEAACNKPAENFIEALKSANVIEIDGIFVGRNWSLDDDSDGEVCFYANYVDDDTSEEYKWHFSNYGLTHASYSADGSWGVNCVINGHCVVRLYTLETITGVA